MRGARDGAADADRCTGGGGSADEESLSNDPVARPCDFDDEACVGAGLHPFVLTLNFFDELSQSTERLSLATAKRNAPECVELAAAAFGNALNDRAEVLIDCDDDCTHRIANPRNEVVGCHLSEPLAYKIDAVAPLAEEDGDRIRDILIDEQAHLRRQARLPGPGCRASSLEFDGSLNVRKCQTRVFFLD